MIDQAIVLDEDPPDAPPEDDGRPAIWKPVPGSSQVLVLSCPVSEILMHGTRGPGKGLPLSEPVYTPQGPIPIGKVHVGTYISCPDGTRSQVIGVYPQGKRPIFEFTYDDGATSRCDDLHIWPIHAQGERTKKAGQRYRLLTTTQVVEKFRKGKRLHIPTLDAISMMDPGRQKRWPVEPYVLGLLLGDGAFHKGGMLTFCTIDDALGDAIRDAGMTEAARPKRQPNMRVFHAHSRSPVHQGIKRLGLLRHRSWEKRVPSRYLHASATTRLAILQGLLDTDGTADGNGYVTFSSCSRQLSMDVQYLAWSLGAKATLTQKACYLNDDRKRDAYIVYIQAAGKFEPFRLERKQSRVRGYMHPHLWRRIVDIKELPAEETVCIKIDHPAGLFVTRDFVVTHNTDTLLMKFAQHVGAGHGTFWRGIIFRREYKELDDLVVKSKRWFRQAFPRAKWLASKADYKWVWPTGEELLFRVAKTEEDYWSYHGHEYPFVGFDELTLWPDLKVYDVMKSINRCSKPDVPLVYMSTANPYGRGHTAVKQRFIDAGLPGRVIRDEHGTRIHIFGTIAENPYLTDEYIDKIQRDPDVQRRKAWVSGSWDILIGGRFEGAWDANVHVIEPFVIPATWYVDRAFDWGSSAPYAIGWFAESDGREFNPETGKAPKEGDPCIRFPKGTVIMVGEEYGWNGEPNKGVRHTNAEIAKRGLEREAGMRKDVLRLHQRIRPGPADSQIYEVRNGDSIAAAMERAGLSFVAGSKGSGSRIAGWEKLYGMLVAAAADVPEEPGFYVFDTCRQWIRTVPTLARKDKDPDDVDTDQEDHCGDMTRYRLITPKRTGAAPRQIGWVR